MERQCVICHDRQADHQCRQCHKKVCDVCAFKDDAGVFCSRDCAATFRSFMQDKTGAPAKGGGFVKRLVRLIVILVLLALVAGAVYVVGAKKGWFGEEEKSRVIEGQKKLESAVEEKLNE